MQGAVGLGAYWPAGQTRTHSAVALAVAVSVVRPFVHWVRWGVAWGPPGQV